MEQITGKEGKGVQGTGFEGETGSNNYSQLPPSGNAKLGIDADVAAGYSEAAATPDSKGLNVGSGTSDTGGDTMGVAKKFALDAEVITGTVQGGLEGVTEKRKPGQFGVSALSGKPGQMLNEDGYYGSGARKGGTAAQFGEPGRGGSMGLAARGLSGGTGNFMETPQPTEGAQKSKAKAQSGMKGSGGAGNNDVS